MLQCWVPFARRNFALPWLVLFSALLPSCASTTVRLSGSLPQAPVCQAPGERIAALILWRPQWRPDQKDVPLREAAAERGIEQFFSSSGCYSSAEVRRLALDEVLSAERLEQMANSATPKPDRVLAVAVRELGPVVKLLASAALIEGGTEVVLDINAYSVGNPHSFSEFAVHWQNGGPGIIKGVATLEEDMRSALEAGLQIRATQ